MSHHNALGLPDPMDVRPDGLETFLDTLFVALATIVGVSIATLAATLVAPIVPGLGLVVVFVGWPLGFVAAVFALRLGHRALVRSGLPAFVRDTARRIRSPETLVTDVDIPAK
ncbi:hypothetical protein [Haloferax sp. YSMS24]|uniref:hypothetical protein n=1 Tax=unclassified Haloferax TaxID=2625095 RepID=UPI00398CDFC0